MGPGRAGRGGQRHVSEPGLPQPAESDWAELREAQAGALLPRTGMAPATAIDIGNPADIHPHNKQEVGRLALAALPRPTATTS